METPHGATGNTVPRGRSIAAQITHSNPPVASQLDLRDRLNSRRQSQPQPEARRPQVISQLPGQADHRAEARSNRLFEDKEPLAETITPNIPINSVRRLAEHAELNRGISNPPLTPNLERNGKLKCLRRSSIGRVSPTVDRS